MRTYSHKIAKSKLEKKGLSSKQISKVYAYKTKSSQVKAAQRFIAANKSAKRFSPFWSTGLGKYTLQKRIARIESIRFSNKWATLTHKQQAKLEKEHFQKKQQILLIKAKQAKTLQARQDLKEAWRHRYEMKRARAHAGEKAYYIDSTEHSYLKNKTRNVGVEEYIQEHYPDELEKLMKDENLTFQEAIDRLQDKAIADGRLQALQQGSGYGYIDQDYKEIISPI